MILLKDGSRVSLDRRPGRSNCRMGDWPTRILVGTDDSEDAALALRAAADISYKTDSGLHLVHAWQGYPLQPVRQRSVSSARAIEEYDGPYRQEAGQLMREQVHRIEVEGADVAGTHLRGGRPAEEIVRLAEEVGADLVVVGSRDLGAAKRIHLGSVSEGVVRLASCPTLVVRGGEKAWPPARIVVGDDPAKEARKAGDLAARIGGLFGAGVLLVRTYSRAELYATAAVAVDTPMPEEVLRIARETLQLRASELEGSLGRRLRASVAVGDAAVVLEEAAKGEVGPTLVAVESRNRIATGRASAVGDLVAHVLKSVKGPILIVPVSSDDGGRRSVVPEDGG
jgi:nucleotide-binding universal stress UspA family protein